MKIGTQQQRPCPTDRTIWFNNVVMFTKDADGIGWLVGCFGFNGPLRQFSIYRAISRRDGERGEKKCPNNPNLHVVQAQ